MNYRLLNFRSSLKEGYFKIAQQSDSIVVIEFLEPIAYKHDSEIKFGTFYAKATITNNRLILTPIPSKEEYSWYGMEKPD